MRTRALRLLAAGLLLGGLGADGARAQLLSPGPLTSAHAELEGIRNCTSCHELGRRGIAPDRCLACHTPLRDRIRAGEGFHASVERDCASCHKDHAGRAFDPVRLDERRFDHAETGYALTGAHRRVECQDCHRPAHITDPAVRRFKGEAGRLDRTLLGVDAACVTCHRDESPHRDALAQADCQSCHVTTAWDALPDFDHGAETDFALAGAHARLDCASCHGESPERFEGLAATCQSCHRADSPHGAQFRGQDCASCHAASAWAGAERFDHGRTAFPLVGEHRRVSCGGCHAGSGPARTFAGVAAGTCADCHEDAHAGALGADCQTCHTPRGWETMNRGFDAGRFDHAAQTGFALVGAHARLDCSGCHATPARRDDAVAITFADASRGATFPRIEAGACADCHRDYHEGAFDQRAGGAACDGCHTAEAWAPTTFSLERHGAETAFPLTGAHLATPCFACHQGPDDARPHFEFATLACEGCHVADSPHDATFARADGVTACGDCHATAGWDGGAFDHAARTGFALEGAHDALACQSCHGAAAAGGATAFAGLDPTCAGCHADDDPHRGQFGAATCDRCHDTRAFTLAAFDHDRTAFPLAGAHEGVACASCHRTETAADGTAFVRFRGLSTACVTCHGEG